MGRRKKGPTIEEMLGWYTPHIGHLIEYRDEGISQSGELIRVSYREDINAIQMWIKQDHFPLMVYADQATGCSCKKV